MLILGAAGRDYHNFNVLYKHDKRFTVVAFTHAYGQIPELRHKRYARTRPSLVGTRLLAALVALCLRWSRQKLNDHRALGLRHLPAALAPSRPLPYLSPIVLRYPPALAGPLYPQGIPIHPEDQLEALIRQHGVQRCVMSYSGERISYFHASSSSKASFWAPRLTAPFMCLFWQT